MYHPEKPYIIVDLKIYKKNGAIKTSGHIIQNYCNIWEKLWLNPGLHMVKHSELSHFRQVNFKCSIKWVRSKQKPTFCSQALGCVWRIALKVKVDWWLGQHQLNNHSTVNALASPIPLIRLVEWHVSGSQGSWSHNIYKLSANWKSF